MPDHLPPPPPRDPADAVRRVARVMNEEAAALAGEHPVVGAWLDEIATAILRHVTALVPD